MQRLEGHTYWRPEFLDKNWKAGILNTIHTSNCNYCGCGCGSHATCLSATVVIFFCSSGLLAPTSLSICSPSLRKKKVGVALISQDELNSWTKQTTKMSCQLSHYYSKTIQQILLSCECLHCITHSNLVHLSPKIASLKRVEIIVFKKS